MQFSKLSICAMFAAAFCTGALFAGGQSGGWRPSKPIRIIVPWEAGSSVDQVTRITAAELGKEFKARFVFENQPGDSGAIGIKSAMDAPKDGYTWAAGMTADLATYRILGLLDTSIKNDWDIFVSLGNVGVIGVSANSRYQTFDQLLADLKANPGQISVAAAGQLSEGHINMEVIRRFTGVNYKLAVYGDAKSAVAAAASGEVPVTTQSAAEQADMIRARRIRPLAVISDADMNLEGYGVIPSIKKSVPNFSFGLNYFGIFIPKGVPPEVITAITRIWNEKISGSAELKKIAQERSLVLSPASGDDAQDKAFGWYQPAAWLYFDAGSTAISPNRAGIPRP